MASKTESYKAIECCGKIKISSFVNDHGGMYETYKCTIYDRKCAEKTIYIRVDHLKHCIMLGKWGHSNADILAILNGNTKSLDQLEIKSFNETKLGRLQRNTIVSNASNSAIMECVLLPKLPADQPIMRDPTTKNVLANLRTSDPSDSMEVTTIIFESVADLDAEAKMLILLLAFKIFKETASPKIIIPSLYYRKIDQLDKIQNISISKTSSKKDGRIDCNYFAALDMSTNQHLLTLEACTDQSGVCRLKVSDCKGQTLFTAEPLMAFNDTTKVLVDNTTVIGYTQRYALHPNTPQKAELRSHAAPQPNDPNWFHTIRRWITSQHVAVITPDSSTYPVKVKVDIYPAVDAVHKAVILTFVMKLIYNFDGFSADKLRGKRGLPQTSTAPGVPKRFKATTSSITESSENPLMSCNPVVAPMNPLALVNIGASTSRGQPIQAHTFPSQIRPSSTTNYISGNPFLTAQLLPPAYRAGNPLYTTQPPHGNHPNIQQPYITYPAYAGQGYPGHQLSYAGVGSLAGQINPVNLPMNLLQQPYANQLYQNYQPTYPGQGGLGGQRQPNIQLLRPLQQAYHVDQTYQHYQSPYPGQGRSNNQ